MHNIIILDHSILTQKKDNSNVEDSEDYYFKVEFFSKDAKKH